MNINDAFPSKYLKASDLQGRAVSVVIKSIEHGDAEMDNKPIVYFEGKDKGLVLNKTNAMSISSDYGPETNGWIGKTIELFSQKVQFNNQMVDSIRVRAVNPALNDDIPPGF